MTTLQIAAHERREVDHLCRHGRQRGFRDRRALATVEHFRLHRYHDQRQYQHRRRQHRAAVAGRYRNHGSERRRQHGADPEQLRADHRAAERGGRSCPRCSASSIRRSGDRYLFSGSAINTPSVASYDAILNGTTTQAGLKQVIAERQQADLGANGLGRLVLTSPTPTSVQVAEDVAGSPFGLKLAAVSSTLTGATVTGPAGSPAADFGRSRRHQSEQRRQVSFSSTCRTARRNRSS